MWCCPVRTSLFIFSVRYTFLFLPLLIKARMLLRPGSGEVLDLLFSASFKGLRPRREIQRCRLSSPWLQSCPRSHLMVVGCSCCSWLLLLLLLVLVLGCCGCCCCCCCC